MRVLIADDHKGVGAVLADLVRACRHDVVEVVGSGFDAIQAYHRHHPDMVLMDYYMPRLNGATACRNILARHADARIVIVSAAASADIRSSGAIAVLPKPVKLESLSELLNEAASPAELTRSN